MRVLWLSPWLRTLARVHAEALADRGHDVLLVTSDQHPEPTAPRPYELVLRPRPKDPATWWPLVAARRRVASFAPEVVVAELVRDPRWTALAPSVPRVGVVHDDRPHDSGEERPRWERALFDRWARGARSTVAFSQYVADQLSGVAAPPVRVVPLTSDLAERDVPPFTGPDLRRDIHLIGRMADYKNLAVVLRAWQAHVGGSGWRGDRLVLTGEGPMPVTDTPHVIRRNGRFAYGDTVAELARAKASVVHYRLASQSGAQVLAMQLGVMPIVSPAGALPEFQPPGGPVVGVDDIDGLRAAFDHLADPSRAVLAGRSARRHYDEHFAAARAARFWEETLRAAIADRRSTGR